MASLEDDLPDEENNDWPHELNNRVEEILDRKRSSVQGREKAYATFCRLTKLHYAEDEIASRTDELMRAFCKSIKFETDEAESAMALHALELLAISVSDNSMYEHVEPLLTRTIRDSTSLGVKEAAIRCLGACTIFGGAGEYSIMEQMAFLLDIVASDGHSIDAPDSGFCVSAALQEWGFLATEIEDLESESEEAIQIFMDQLNSNRTSVQIAAGENIALLYEKSYTPQEDNDDVDEEEEEEDEHEKVSGDSKLIKRYNAYHNTHELMQQLESLTHVHDKRISRRSRLDLHTCFASILTTVENPRRGPMYSKAIDQNTDKHYGSRHTVKIGRDGVMTIDRWWKWVRLNTLRRILSQGFTSHYYGGNRAVLDNLPVMVRMTSSNYRSSKKTAKPRTSHRFAMAGGSDDDD